VSLAELRVDFLGLVTFGERSDVVEQADTGRTAGATAIKT